MYDGNFLYVLGMTCNGLFHRWYLAVDWYCVLYFIIGHVLRLEFGLFLPQPIAAWSRNETASGHHWVVLADEEGNPLLLLDADAALRAALLDKDTPYDIYKFCRRPLVIRDTEKTIAEVIKHLKSLPTSAKEDDSAIDYDAVLIWGDEPRIITGADILGKLLKDIKSTDLA